MPGNSASPAAMRATVLARTSSFTGRDTQPDSRSCPRVAGRDVIVIDPTLGPVRPFLAWVVAVVLACDLAIVGVRTAGSQTHVHVRVVPAGPPRTIVVPPKGQASVTGTVTDLIADADVLDAVPPPFTINVAARGEGGATISGALVDGRRVAIVWDAG